MAHPGVAAPQEDAERSGAWIVFSDECGGLGYSGAPPLIVPLRKAQPSGECRWMTVHQPRRWVGALGVPAQRTQITQRDVPALIGRVHGQLAAPLVLVWDNHSLHTVGRVRRELADREWASVGHILRYAPELNLIETLWSHLKTVLANRAFRNLEELEKLVRAPLRSVPRSPGLLRGFI